MTILILGLALWVLAHLFKRVSPGGRAGLDARFGDGPAKGIVAAMIALSLVLMIWGYRSGTWSQVYMPPVWGLHLNNLLMFAAIALFGFGASKGRARSWLRHPMLTGVLVWAVAHLLVNGDSLSIVLFGGLGVWAVAEMLVINAKAGPWVRPEPGPAKGDIRLILITLVLYGIISAIHAWLGYWPFPG